MRDSNQQQQQRRTNGFQERNWMKENKVNDGWFREKAMIFLLFRNSCNILYERWGEREERIRTVKIKEFK